MRVLFSQKLIAISKPRCASTTLRRLLDPLIDDSFGDIAVDVAGQRPPYHPHHSAPYLKELLRADGFSLEGMETIILTRNPLEMLWSYFKYFQPDCNSVYNYQPNKWMPQRLMSFDDWLVNGHVGMHPRAKELAPSWISTSNLTPLSLEAHIQTRDGKTCVDRVFQVERLQDLAAYLKDKTGRNFKISKLNESKREDIPMISNESFCRIREMFPLECESYML